ncbi:hypothetical protein BWQ96_09806 [Gracilariopsis chorda]|uniref:Uncharacterized protein n=1 Tax=Gracilariopsis chorda TaxID=448386 RepID=A0A2V3IEJ4_9FLOR|nr:hypothetical protein BWQ96_09806 [Gracilariopsis chorda]|eukprot:PXF40483.1 hypothetical protein BWQ96_09806 [Gracilariopsis chorda]
MPSVRQPPTSKRRRSSEKNGRRFSVKDSRKQPILPTFHTGSRKSNLTFTFVRIMAVAAMAILIISVSSMIRRAARSRNFTSRYIVPSGSKGDKGNEQTEIPKAESDGTDGNDQAKSVSSDDDVKTDVTSDASAPSADETNTKADEEGQDNVQSGHASLENSNDAGESSEQKKVPYMERASEYIEWYSRDDYMEGSRPICRISKPYVLSNGTILLPDWLSSHEKVLDRCGLGNHGFYSGSTGPQGLSTQNEIDADLVLTVHPERFQEPTHVPSVYLTEHILKSSYLFGVFGGSVRSVDGIGEHHCYTTASETKCDESRPAPDQLKPAIFVPTRIEQAPEGCWSRKYVELLGDAHGNGNGIRHLNTSSLLIKSHKGQIEDLMGTRFRSVMMTPGMFRHLPDNGLKMSRFFSMKTGIHKELESKSSGKCSITIGIATGKEGSPHGIEGGSDLKDKIEELGKYALPEVSLEVKSIDVGPDISFDDHVKQMQILDMYIAGSGDDMSSIGFLHSQASSFELMPFASKPLVHKNLARILGLQYMSFSSKPQDGDFKRCIDGEIFSLRKRGQLPLSEKPDWYAPLMKAWNDAVKDYALSGSSDFDIIGAEKPVNNYHSRACALKQRVEVETDEIARKLVQAVKEKCN